MHLLHPGVYAAALHCSVFFCVIVNLRYVLTLFKTENVLSVVALVTGMVRYKGSRAFTSLNICLVANGDELNASHRVFTLFISFNMWTTWIYKFRNHCQLNYQSFHVYVLLINAPNFRRHFNGIAVSPIQQEWLQLGNYAEIFLLEMPTYFTSNTRQDFKVQVSIYVFW